VELEESKQSAIADALIRKDGIFNFATVYYYKNSNLSSVPNITDADFEAFKQYLKKEKFEFDTETEVALKATLEVAKKEKVDESISAEYQQLLAALQKSEEKELNSNKRELKQLLTDELIKRYQYKEGLYKYYTTSNPEILKSAAILSNPAEYNKILKK
jgi:carboxyl-terminal processing protease